MKVSTRTIRDKLRESHGLMMLLCCLIPLVVAGILFYFGFKNYAIFAVMLLCPILHYFMMKGMHKKEAERNRKDSCH